MTRAERERANTLLSIREAAAARLAGDLPGAANEALRLAAHVERRPLATQATLRLRPEAAA